MVAATAIMIPRATGITAAISASTLTIAGGGIGSGLYAARKGTVQRLNRRGIVAGGLIPGFADFKDRISVQEYVDRVVAGDLQDSTLSFQLGRGFVVRGLLEDYIEDAASDNWATLIVWTNPYFKPNQVATKLSPE